MSVDGNDGEPKEDEETIIIDGPEEGRRVVKFKYGEEGTPFGDTQLVRVAKQGEHAAKEVRLSEFSSYTLDCALFLANMKLLAAVLFEKVMPTGVAGQIMYEPNKHTVEGSAAEYAFEFVRKFSNIDGSKHWPGPEYICKGRLIMECPALERQKKFCVDNHHNLDDMGCCILFAVALSTVFMGNLRVADLCGPRSHDVFKDLKSGTSPAKYFSTMSGTMSLLATKFKDKVFGGLEYKLACCVLSMLNWICAMLLSHDSIALAQWTASHAFVRSYSQVQLKQNTRAFEKTCKELLSQNFVPDWLKQKVTLFTEQPELCDGSLDIQGCPIEQNITPLEMAEIRKLAAGTNSKEFIKRRGQDEYNKLMGVVPALRASGRRMVGNR